MKNVRKEWKVATGLKTTGETGEWCYASLVAYVEWIEDVLKKTQKENEKLRETLNEIYEGMCDNCNAEDNCEEIPCAMKTELKSLLSRIKK